MIDFILCCVVGFPFVIGGVLAIAEFGKWLFDVLFG